MKKWFILVAFAMVLGSLAIVASCGETNPAQAPAGAGIEFVTETGDGESVTVTLDFSINKTYDVLSVCEDAFVSNMIQICEQLRTTEGASAEAIAACKDETEWSTYFDRTPSGGSGATYGDIAKNFDAGDCGYYEQILVAIVSRASGSSASTDVIAGVPLNGVEVRWVSQGAGLELYELADVPGDIPPLANPYMDETDDRGVTELKVRFPNPVRTGVSGDLIVTVDIGVDLAAYKFTVTAEESDTTSGGDDDASDDDVG